MSLQCLKAQLEQLATHNHLTSIVVAESVQLPESCSGEKVEDVCSCYLDSNHWTLSDLICCPLNVIRQKRCVHIDF